MTAMRKSKVWAQIDLHPRSDAKRAGPWATTRSWTTWKRDSESGRVRGSREFTDRATYTRFLQHQVKQRNLTRQVRWAEEQAVLRPLPATWLALCQTAQRPGCRSSVIVLFIS